MASLPDGCVNLYPQRDKFQLVMPASVPKGLSSTWPCQPPALQGSPLFLVMNLP